MRLYRRFEQGFSLIELAIVLAIVGLLIAGIWLALSSTLKNNREKRTTQEIIQIVFNIRRLYENQTKTDGMDTTNLITAGVFPPEMVTNSTTVKNVWGGNVTAGYYSSSDRFKIVYPLVPPDSCIKIISSNLITVDRDKLLLVRVEPTSNFYPPVRPEDVVAACTATPTATIMWIFNLR